MQLKQQIAYRTLSVFFLSVLAPSCVKPPPITPPNQVYVGIDKFQEELATRVSNKFDPNKTVKDFKIVVTQAAYPIGTILRPNTTIPIDYTVCIPVNTPPSAEAESLFPLYSLSKGLAIDVGLDNDLIKSLVDFGITIKDTDTIQYSVKNTTAQMLSDSEISKLSAGQECGAIIKKQPTWLVRGYITGQRNFSTKNEAVNKVKGKIQKFGSFNIDIGTGNALLSIVDDNSKKFLQIISEVTFMPEASTTTVSLPTVLAANGRIYVQKDRADNSTIAENIVKQLMNASFPVDKTVEKIDSSRVPKVAQIRYFNQDDKDQAGRVAEILKGNLPNIKLVRIGLPAPKGQLEVWLPQVKN